MFFRYKLNHSICRRFCVDNVSRSFDVDLVSSNFAKRTEWASANFGNSGAPFRMVLPPPNVTGKLHIGHALTVVVEDSICRHHRAKGGVAIWTPGFDHAGIATQSVVERELWKAEKKLRHDLSRDEFISECKAFSTKNAEVISSQLKRMGATLDWENSYYTLDDKFSSAVTRAFVSLHKDNKIFRDKRIVQWCPQLRSSLSDQEVERLDVGSGEVLTIKKSEGGSRSVKVGVMHKVKYMVKDSRDCLEVGTTRPETLFADVALAVHPSDSRYSKFIGKLVEHPLIGGRFMPVIADESVKMDKGTGVVKITPHHDGLDFAIASRHWDEISSVDLSSKNRVCMNEDGKLINVPDEFLLMDRFDAREKVIEHLTASNHYGGCLKHENAQISICSRTGDIIEPRLTEQWFLDTKDMHKDVEEALKRGEIKITANFHEQRMIDWLSNVEPWCLSRQVLWGHRIPAYTTDGLNWIISNSLNEAKEILKSDNVVQDNDVLDTWFSSSLVPLVTAGWMDNTLDKNQPPLHVMETGWDILGFWVIRMLMLTQKLSGQVAFPQIVLHGLVRDSNGRKMSKSLGNVIDPMDVLNGISQENMIIRLNESSLGAKEKEASISEMKKKHPDGIPKFGADALRFALLRHDVLSMDVPINIVETAGEGYRFCNKVWNLIQYAESVNDKCNSSKEFDTEHPADLWILSRLAAVLKEVDEHMMNHSPHIAFTTLQNFILSNICDVYLEATKKDVWDEYSKRTEEIRCTLTRVLQPTLVQLSVFMPFVSEHLYERLFKREKGSIYFDFIKASYFQLHRDTDLEKTMNLVLSIVTATRSVRQRLQMPAKLVFEGILFTDKYEIAQMNKVISDLGNIKITKICDLNDEVPAGFMPSCLPGFDDRLALKIEAEHQNEFVGRLEGLLAKAEERRKLFDSKAEKYEEIVKRDEKDEKVKKNVLEKSKKKAAQARKVAQSAAVEAERIKALLLELKL